MFYFVIVCTTRAHSFLLSLTITNQIYELKPCFFGEFYGNELFINFLSFIHEKQVPKLCPVAQTTQSENASKHWIKSCKSFGRWKFSAFNRLIVLGIFSLRGNEERKKKEKTEIERKNGYFEKVLDCFSSNWVQFWSTQCDYN